MSLKGHLVLSGTNTAVEGLSGSVKKNNFRQQNYLIMVRKISLKKKSNFEWNKHSGKRGWQLGLGNKLHSNIKITGIIQF